MTHWNCQTIFFAKVMRNKELCRELLEMKAFLNYLSKQTVESLFVERLDREVQRVKENKEWRREYMTLQMKLDDRRVAELGLLRASGHLLKCVQS